MKTARNTTFLLLAGTWCGGWCWKFVADILSRNGFRVETPSFSGLGDRAHLLTPSLSLEDHINDIINVIRYNSLEHVVIVGHSYAGLPITCALDRLSPSCINHTVYIDGLLPENGENGAGMMSPAEIAPFFRGTLHRGALGIPVPIIPKGKFPEEQRRWFQNMMTPHPVRTYQDHVCLIHPPGNGIPQTLIACMKLKMPTLLRSRERAVARGWNIIPIESGHNAHLQYPDLVANILMDLPND